MNKLSTLFIATIVATTLAPVGAQTTAIDGAKMQGYVADARGGFITSANGACWHTNEWSSTRPVEPCDLVPKPVAVVVAAKETPVAQPAPMSTPPVEAPVPTKFSLSAGTLFAFDKADLKPEGKSALDELIRKLEGATFETILVTGHTDRIGSPQYNQKLSEQRAQSVKNYLTEHQVQANRVDARGKGESDPVTKLNECQGASTAKVIACLQPDRRVDIELQGAMKRVSK